MTGALRAQLDHFLQTRQHCIDGVFESLDEQATVRLLRFNAPLAAALAPFLTPRQQPLKLARSIRREYVFWRILRAIRPVNCKICLETVQVWSLPAHSTNCFNLSFQKSSLQKLNGRILAICEEIRQTASSPLSLAGRNPQLLASRRDSRSPRRNARHSDTAKPAGHPASAGFKESSLESKLKAGDAPRISDFTARAIAPLTLADSPGKVILEEPSSRLSMSSLPNNSEIKIDCSIAENSLRPSNLTNVSLHDLLLKEDHPEEQPKRNSYIQSATSSQFLFGNSIAKRHSHHEVPSSHEALKEMSARRLSYFKPNSPSIAEQTLQSPGKKSSKNLDESLSSPLTAKGNQTAKEDQQTKVDSPSDSKAGKEESFPGQAKTESAAFLESKAAPKLLDTPIPKFAEFLEVPQPKNSVNLNEFDLRRKSSQVPTAGTYDKREEFHRKFSLNAYEEKSEPSSEQVRSRLELIDVAADFARPEQASTPKFQTDARVNVNLNEKAFAAVSEQKDRKKSSESARVFVFDPEVIGPFQPHSPQKVRKVSMAIEEAAGDNTTEENCPGDMFNTSRSVEEMQLSPNLIVSPLTRNMSDVDRSFRIDLQQVAETSAGRDESAARRRRLEAMSRLSNTEYSKAKSPEAEANVLRVCLGREVAKYRESLLANPFFGNFFHDKETKIRLERVYVKAFAADRKLTKMVKQLAHLADKRFKVITRSKKYINALRTLSEKSFGRFHRENYSRSSSNLNEMEELLGQPREAGQRSTCPLPTLEALEPAGRLDACAEPPLASPREPLRRAHSDSELIADQLKEKMYDLKTATVKLDDFVIQKELGKGAYGKVYLVKHKLTGDIFAMKVIKFPHSLSQKFVQTLQNEISILKLIKGKFLAKAFYSFIESNCLFIIMEYLVGGDFRSRLDIEVTFEPGVAQFYSAELVLALEEVHRKVVHRDLKPENLLIDANGHLKLADFGLSELHIKYLDLSSQEGKACFSPHIKGTPDYIPPEVLFGEQPDHAARALGELSPSENSRRRFEVIDWWAVGCLVYEFLVGVTPFGGNSIPEVVDNIRRHEIEWPPVGYDEGQISPEAKDIIERLLNADPTQRLGFDGAERIKRHAFFRGVDWERLRFNRAFFAGQPAGASSGKVNKLSIRSRHEVNGKTQLQDLQMNRIDLLHENNLKLYAHVKARFDRLLRDFGRWSDV